jgi:hypothetical protein
MQLDQAGAEKVRAQLEHLISTAPSFEYGVDRTIEDTRWLAKAEAMLSQGGELVDVSDFRLARARLGTFTHDPLSILRPVMTAYYRVEALCPPSAQGVFIPQGDEWGGFAALVSLLSVPRETVLVVDPYLDAKAYCEVVGVAKAGEIRFLAATTYRDGLNVAHAKRLASGDSTVHLRYGKKGALHDRLIILDNAEVWLVSQSLKDIAIRSPASLSKADDGLARMKIAAYALLWEEADDGPVA